MDKDFIKSLLLSKQDDINEKLIKDGDFIDSELLQVMSKASIKNLQYVFYQHNKIPNGGYRYTVELKCPSCGCVHTKAISKTGLMEILGYKNTYSNNKYINYCGKCKKEKEEQDKAEKENRENYYKENSRIKIDNYIENYLDSNKKFKEGVSAYEKITCVMPQFCDFDFDEKIRNVVLGMDYSDFLHTPYWDGIRSYKLKKSKYRCQLCGKNGFLNVHHKTYEHHGLEHNRSISDNDLIVLCQNCHEKFHDKLSD